jgi:hypothetical protein
VTSRATRRPTSVVERDNGYRRSIDPNRSTLRGVEGIVEPWRVAILRFYFFFMPSFSTFFLYLLGLDYLKEGRSILGQHTLTFLLCYLYDFLLTT